jgi:hypothetical protein
MLYTRTSTETASAHSAGKPVTVPVSEARDARPFRLAVGLLPTQSSGLLIPVVGLALGPYGVGIVSDSAIAMLDPAVSVAITALGVSVGFDLAVRRTEGRLLAAVSIDAAVTVAIVTLGMAALLRVVPGVASMPWPLALMIGICAAPSSSAVPPPGDSRSPLLAPIGGIHDVLPILLSAIAITWARPGTFLALSWLTIQGGLIAVSIAFASSLLMAETSSEEEQRVFVIGALLLIGGAAAYLQLSPLFTGLAAGLLWGFSGRGGSGQLARDLEHMQRPLAVILLIVAGARVVVAPGIVTLAIVYIALRLIGKAAGGGCAWFVGRNLPSASGAFRTSPGLVGIAIAVNLLQAHVESSAMVCAVVIAGTLGSGLLSHLFHDDVPT